MGLYIHGLKLPEWDGDADISITVKKDGTATCTAWYEPIEIAKDHPVTEMQPHGRLVDVEKIKNTIGKFIGYLDEDMITRINIAINKEVPTVIEAEE